mgnify:CR=1 FL=1|jgi:hypothetical protein
MNVVLNFFKDIGTGFKKGHQSLKIVLKNKKLILPVILIALTVNIFIIINSMAKPTPHVQILLQILSTILISFFILNAMYFTKKLIIDNYKIRIIESLKTSIKIAKKSLFWIVTLIFTVISVLYCLKSIYPVKMLSLTKALSFFSIGAITLYILTILLIGIFTALTFESQNTSSKIIFNKGLIFAKKIISETIGLYLYMILLVIIINFSCGFIGGFIRGFISQIMPSIVLDGTLVKSIARIIPIIILTFWASTFYCFFVKRYKAISK